jgi:hypothetical protein
MGDRAAKLVGWADDAAWQRVMHGLFSADPREMREAIGSVESWRARGQLPLAIEVRMPHGGLSGVAHGCFPRTQCTQSLVQAVCFDRERVLSAPPGVLEAGIAQHAYALAVVR